MEILHESTVLPDIMVSSVFVSVGHSIFNVTKWFGEIINIKRSLSPFNTFKESFTSSEHHVWVHVGSFHIDTDMNSDTYKWLDDKNYCN